MATTEEKCYCAICGKELSDSNSWKQPDKLGIRYIPYCLSCQQKVFMWLSSCIGYKLAMFFMCAQMNIPYLPNLFPEIKTYKGDKGAWIGYVIAVRKSDKERGGGLRGFENGVTDIRKAFKTYASLEVDDEMLSAEEYENGIKVQQERWGNGPADAPYTPEDYEVLNKQYIALTEERPNRNTQAELAIIRICKWTLEQEKLIAKKEYADAQKIGSLIEKEMSGEELRKKDQRAENVARLDDIVLAVERAGLNIPDEDELLTLLANHSFHPQYPITLDAADQMLLQIINASRWNEGLTEFDRLPDGIKLTDELGEFSPVADSTEKYLYKELQLVPMTSETTPPLKTENEEVVQ